MFKKPSVFNKSSMLTSFIMVFVLLNQPAMASSKVTDENVYSYLQLSGADKALDGIPLQIQGMGQQMQLTAKDPVESKKVMEKILASWNEEVIDKQVFSYVKNNISAEQMSELLTWLNSDFSRRIKLAEEQAAEANFEQAFMHYMGEIRSNPPSESRIVLVRDFVESTNVVENTVDMMVDISKTMIANLAPNENNQAEIDAQMTQMRAMMLGQMEQQMIMVSYFLYRDITDHDLTKYVDFYKTDLGQKEIKVMYGAIGQAMTSWASAMSKELAKDREQKIAG